MTDAPPPYPGINGYNGYVGAAAGASAPPMTSAEAKAAEAAASGTQGQVQNGWYDPNNPGAAFVPAGANELPPSYEDSQKKDK